MSGDCCNEIRERLVEIERLLASLPRVNKEEIIREAVNRVKPEIEVISERLSELESDVLRKIDTPIIVDLSVEEAKGVIAPIIALQIANALNPVNRAIADVGSTATKALGTATQAGANAASALSRIIGLAADLASLAISVATLKTLSYRVDALEGFVDSVATTASDAFSIASLARRIGERAFGTATTADGKATTAKSTAEGAYSAANEATRLARSANLRAEDAQSTGRQALSTANTANSTANTAQSTAQQARTTADTANSTAQQARTTANAAQSTAQQARTTANAAQSTAQQARTTANAAQSTAQQARTTADTANSTAQQARTTANAAQSTAQQARVSADIAQSTAQQARASADAANSAAQAAQSTANNANVTANAALGLAANAMAGVNILSGAVGAVGATAAEGLAKATQALNGVTNLRNIVAQLQASITRMIQQITSRLDKTDALILGIPLALAASAPYLSSMTNVATAGTCNASQPGGCLDKAIERGNGNLFNWLMGQNALNTAGLAAGINAVSAQVAGVSLKVSAVSSSIAGLVTQVATLSELVTNKFGKLFKSLGVDRLLNLISAWGTIHNAYMLSSALADTFFSILDNTFSLLVDAEGVDINTREIIGGKVEDWIKGLIGVQTFNGIKTEWKKYNRIYQAAANLLNTLQSIGYSILSALEVVGSYVASIGNALRRAGEVMENAYKWMNPTPNFQNRFFTAIENAQNIAQSIDQVAAEVREGKEAFDQLKEQKKELEKALKQEKETPQGSIPPEAEEIATEAEETKSVSQAPVIQESDKFKPSN